MAFMIKQTEQFETLIREQALTLEALALACLDCSVHKRNADITSDVYLVIDLSRYDTEHKTLILSRGHLPVVTDKTTLELKKASLAPYEEVNKIAQDTFTDYYGNHKKAPSFNADNLFLPLEGDIRKTSSYLNLAMIDTVGQTKQHDPIISFCNGLEVILPFTYRCIKDNCENALTFYLQYHVTLSHKNPLSVHHIPGVANWSGKYARQHPEILQFVLKHHDSVRSTRIRHKTILTIRLRGSHIEMSQEEVDEYMDIMV